MKTVRLTVRRGWLAAVIGVLGIIGGARQQVWASSALIPQSIQRHLTAGSAGIPPANFSQPINVTRRLEAAYVFGLTAARKAWSPGFSRLGIRLAPTRHNFGRAAG